MKTTGYENLGSLTMDFLVADGAHPQDVCLVTILKSGKLTKGTVLALAESGKCVSLGTAKASGETNAPTAAYILAEDVDATDADAIAEAFRSGSFLKNKLTVASSYTMTESDEQELRKCGIFLSKGME